MAAREVDVEAGKQRNSWDMFAATRAAARSEFPADAVYADWAARALPLRCACGQPSCAWCSSKVLPTFVPHPHSGSSLDAASPVRSARAALSVLLCNVGVSHDIILGASATDMLRAVTYRLPWHANSLLACHTHAHSALLGVRGPAMSQGASFCALDSVELDNTLLGAPRLKQFKSMPHGIVLQSNSVGDQRPFAVLAFPGECNLTGAIYPYAQWAEAAHTRSWYNKWMPEYNSIDTPESNVATVTLVDAAALAANTEIKSEHLRYVDLMVLSIYKITGCPTGLGVLLVRRGSNASRLLHSTAGKAYFGGGRGVSSIAVRSSSYIVPSSNLVDTFEIGTPNLDAIVQIPTLTQLIAAKLGGMQNVHKRACQFADHFRRLLLESFPAGNINVHQDRHGLGGVTGGEVRQGPIVSFSLFAQDHAPVGHREVEATLRSNSIYVRSGAMCNPGACAEAVNLRSSDPHESRFDMVNCREDVDIVDGRHTGVVRASFGWANTETDVIRIVEVLRANFGWKVRAGRIPHENGVTQRRCVGHIAGLFIFPLKGGCGQAVCSAFAARNTLGMALGGLAGDRCLAVKNMDTNELLSSQTSRQLDDVQVAIVGSKSNAMGSHDNSGEYDMALKIQRKRTSWDGRNADHDRITMVLSSGEYGLNGGLCWMTLREETIEACNKWLDGAFRDMKARLVVSDGEHYNLSNRGNTVHVVNLASCTVVARALGDGWSALRIARQSRANVVVDGLPPWSEDSWRRVGNIAELQPCVRCSSMSVDRGEPLRTIIRLRRALPGHRQLVTFGVVGRIVENIQASTQICQFNLDEQIDVCYEE